MNQPPPTPGKISWIDLTVENAEEIREFYQQVTGWTNSPVEMDGYHDYCMIAPDGETVAGICHARGDNADLPPVWLVYINVADIQQGIAKCKSLGGEIVQGPRDIGGGICAVIKDPAGAIAALYQQK